MLLLLQGVAYFWMFIAAVLLGGFALEGLAQVVVRLLEQVTR